MSAPEKAQQNRTSNSGHTRRYRGRPRRNLLKNRPIPGTNGFVTRDELHGGKLNVPENPPEISYQPWMPLIVVIRGTGGALVVTVKKLQDTLVDQIDPLRHAFRPDSDRTVNSVGGPLLQFRIRSIRAWNLTGNMIALSANDLTDNNSKNTDCLCGLVDTGGQGHTPAVGFKYPASHSDLVLRCDQNDKSDPLFHIIIPTGDSSIVYVNVFWRCDGPSKFSGFTRSMIAIVQQINNRTAKITEQNKVQTKKLDEIAKHTDTTIGSKIIDGVGVVAPYVLAAAAADDVQRMERLIAGIERLGDDASVASSSFEQV